MEVIQVQAEDAGVHCWAATATLYAERRANTRNIEESVGYDLNSVRV